ncbi:uncharacterized protein LOC144773457 [Lissotriton helveticus]
MVKKGGMSFDSSDHVAEAQKLVEKIKASTAVANSAGPASSSLTGSGPAQANGENALSAQAPVNGKEVSLPLLGDGLVPTRSENLGQHVSKEVKEMIWAGKYVYIYSLLLDNREMEQAKVLKEWMYPSEWRAQCSRFRVEETLKNWIRAFAVLSAITAERPPNVQAEMACYLSRIVGWSDQYTGDAWKEYDVNFRKSKEFNASLAWDKVDSLSWHKQFSGDSVPSQPISTVRVFSAKPHQPFRATQGSEVPGKSRGTGSEKRGVCWDFNRRTCTRPQGTCRFRHACSICGHPSHPETTCRSKPGNHGHRGRGKPE